MTKIPCTVEILSYNSVGVLPRVLESVKDFSDVILLDGGSTDGTLELAKRYGVRVISQRADASSGPIDDFSAVRNRGITHAEHKWFFYIDSDEYASPALVEEIRNITERGDERSYGVYRVPRVYVVDGVIIENASTYPNYQLRFFYIPTTVGFQKKVHEQIKAKESAFLGTLKSPIYVPLEPFFTLKKKWQKYIELQLSGVSLTWGRLFRSIRSNSVKFFSYLFKSLWIYVYSSGTKLPFSYEWENALYHVKLPVALAKRVLAQYL